MYRISVEIFHNSNDTQVNLNSLNLFCFDDAEKALLGDSNCFELSLDRIPSNYHRFGIGKIVTVQMYPRASKTEKLTDENDDKSSDNISFDSKKVFSLYGALHLYTKQTFSQGIETDTGGNSIKYLEKGLYYAILAIPMDFSPDEFIRWIGTWLSEVSQFKLIKCHDIFMYLFCNRDGSPGRYLCIIKFSNELKAKTFYELYNGKRFSDLFVLL